MQEPFFHLSHSHPFDLLSLARLRFLFLVLTISISSLASSCRACKEETFICGDQVFRYPFGRKSSGCGDPTLQLDCDHQVQRPLLNISGNQYYILFFNHLYREHNNLEGILTIKDKNLHEYGNCNPCQSNYTDFLSSPQFHIGRQYNLNLTLWHECDETNNSSLNDIASFRLCNLNWYYSLNPGSTLNSTCKLKVILPINSLELSIPQLIHTWFEIKWNASEDCWDCDSNGGQCAYDKSSMKFCCECSGKLCANKCPSGIAGKSRTKIVVIGCSIGGAVLVVVILFIVHVKRRRVPPTRGFGRNFSNCHRNDVEAARPGYMMGSLSIFTYRELQQATNFFDEKNKLGDGGFGAVYLGKLQDGRFVAVKRLYEENSRRVEQFINEVKILSSLCHPNLVRLYGCTCPQSPMLLLVYEFVPNGTLSDHLHGDRRTLRGLAWGTRLNIAIETAQALAYLHSIDPPIFHRDVKSNNILLEENFTAKVADFGLCRLVPVNVSHVTTSPQGTPGYVDPEYHQCFQLTEKSDVYSFGVVLVEIISAKVAVDITRNRSEIILANMAIDKIRKGVLDELVDPDLKIEKNHELKVMVGAVAELAYKCLAREREFRPDMKEVVSRLEEIKQLQENKESSDITPTASPISVQNWPSMASDQSAQF